MARLTAATAPILLTAALAAPAVAENLGDVNSDGRVSYADAYLLGEWNHARGHGEDSPHEMAPGSTDFEDVFGCSSGHGMPDLIYLESLRRVSRRAGKTPLPHFFEAWPEAEEEPGPALPPPPDERIVVEVLPSIHRGRTDALFLDVLVETSVPIAALSLVFSADDLDMRPHHADDREPPVKTSTDFYVISGGLLAYRSGLYAPRSGARIPVGETILSLSCEVPRGTDPGTYRVHVVDAEAVAASGDVIRPEARGGTLQITQTIATGIDQEFPRIEFDEAERRIVGPGEFRITNTEGFPGDTLVAAIQLRTPRAVNWVKSVIVFDARALFVEEVIPLYPDPEDGEVRPQDYWIHIAHNDSPPLEGRGELFLLYHTSGKHQRGNTTRAYGEGASTAGLEYVAPLDEWIDLYEIRFRLEPGATGLGETAFEVRDDGRPDRGTWSTGLIFEPYVFPNWAACSDLEPFWSHDSPVISGGKVAILGGGEPPPPPGPPVDPEVASIRFDIGTARGAPGQIVRLPVGLESAVDLWMMRLALRYDGAQLDFAGFEIEGVDANGDPEPGLVTEEAPYYRSMICEGDGIQRICRGGLPETVELRGDGFSDDIPENTLIINLGSAFSFLAAEEGGQSWEAGRRYEIGALRFRVPETATPSRLEVSPATVEWTQLHDVVPRQAVTAGFPILGAPPERGAAVPAVSVTGGVVIVSGESEFIRGDSNRDGSFNVSDPTHTLGILFGGDSEDRDCEDAADANDDGGLNIADPIYSLGHLFGGGSAPPPPFPGPGIDPTEDELRCGEG